MASEPIHIHDDSELPRVLEEADKHPVVFERKGKTYKLTQVSAPEETVEPGAYDPDSLRDAIDRVSGMFTDNEADEIIRKIYEYRRVGSRPPWRP